MTETADAVMHLRAAVDRHRAAIAEMKRTQDERDEAIANALKAKVRPVDIRPLTDLTTEQIRRIGRKRGAAPLREPTKTSRRKQASPESAT
ncbi:hypothetical protein [Embleya sp. NPDC005971]|uniref:hypothetical protein n=1 Tax=Embleya sp. NPDC005971 TaxID=3156724 RepID=UPI0033CACFE3